MGPGPAPPHPPRAVQRAPGRASQGGLRQDEAGRQRAPSDRPRSCRASRTDPVRSTTDEAIGCAPPGGQSLAVLGSEAVISTASDVVAVRTAGGVREIYDDGPLVRGSVRERRSESAEDSPRL